MYSEFSGHSPFPRSDYNSSTYPQTNAGASSVSAPPEAPDRFIKSGEWLDNDLWVRVLATYEDSIVHNLTGTVRLLINIRF